jgi:hypothetical protein
MEVCPPLAAVRPPGTGTFRVLCLRCKPADGELQSHTGSREQQFFVELDNHYGYPVYRHYDYPVEWDNNSRGYRDNGYWNDSKDQFPAVNGCE